jgi:hypothetical protein
MHIIILFFVLAFFCCVIFLSVLLIESQIRVAPIVEDDRTAAELMPVALIPQFLFVLRCHGFDPVLVLVAILVCLLS